MMQHIAIIMDGNRRWANNNKLQTVTMGHRKGVEPIKKSAQWCLDHGVKYLSLYAFSLENAKRSDEEKTAIFSIMAEFIKEETQELIKQGIAVRFVGDRSLFPDVLRTDIEYIEEATAHCNMLYIQVMFFYGGQQEIASAAQRLAQKVKEGTLLPTDITVEKIRSTLWMADVPDPDIVIRSGGHSRLSNFLLFEAAYSEWFFFDTLWPDFDEQHLNVCVEKFGQTKRNFGQ
jgi:undecaprenyl diphosphate synthase